MVDLMLTKEEAKFLYSILNTSSPSAWQLFTETSKEIFGDSVLIDIDSYEMEKISESIFDKLDKKERLFINE